MAKKKTSNKEEETAVLEYLTKTNRPYSATDIFNNLHQKYTKTNITKALEKLIEDDVVYSKVYGKSSIYSIKQNTIATGEENEGKDVASVSKNIEELTEKVEQISSANKKLEQALNAIKNEPTTVDCVELLERTKKENEHLSTKLENLKSGSVLIPREKRKRTNQEFDNNRNLWKKRRGIFRDIFKAVTEHYPGKPDELKEKLGIEEDDVPFEKDPLAAN